MTTFTERQQQIIETAIDLIARGGIQEVTIKKLAQRIGITEPAIYRHFQSKHEILEAIQHYIAGERHTFFMELLEKDITATEKIMLIIKQHFTMFSEKPSFAAVLFSERLFQNDEHLSAMVREIMEQSRATLLRIIAAGQQVRDLRDDIPAEHLVVMVMGSLRLLVNRWHLQRCRYNLVDEGEAFLLSLKKMIGYNSTITYREKA